MQKLSRTIAVIGLLAPLGASALGVGDIRLHSALNQSLKAEIPLVLSGPENIADVKVALAGPEAFAKAGVERQYFLTKLNFEAIRKPDGSHAIEIRSRDVMREPFLTFLVEVNWPQGRILREFTVLMDPPATLPDAGFAETEPAFVARPTRRYEPAAAPDVAEEAPPVRRRHTRRSASPEQQAENRAALGAPPSADQLTGENYGPVQRNENLWSIAKPLAQDAAVSHEQMAIALFRANPQAFGGDINRLRAGATLRIPTKDYINQFGAQQARSAFARQQGGMGGGPAEGGPENQLKLLSPTDAKARAESAASTREGKAKGELALEVAETVKQENEEFRSRLRDLEQKLGELQRLIVLKDQQISSLQAQPRTSEQPPAETRPQPPTPAVKAEPQQPSVAQPVPSPQQPPSMPPPAQVQTEPPAAQPAVPKPPAPRPKPVPAPRPAVTPPPVAEPGFSIEPVYLGAAGAIAGVGLLAWLIRRNRNMKIAETESILLAAERESLQKARLSTSKPGETPLEPVVSPKSSFLSEFTPSDFDALGSESDEVDPIAEADVYLAYGRYKQAEDLIRHAIAQHPDRDECKLKLLEIYSATENRAAFEEYAKSLKQTYKGAKPEFWAKIEDMARDLPPGGDLFQASEAGVQKPKAQASGSAKKAGGLDLSDDLIDDLKRFEIEFAEPAAGEDEEDLFAQFAPPPDEKAEAGSIPGFAAAGAKKPAAGESERGASDNLIEFGRSTPQRPEPAPPKRTEKSIDDILRELTANLSDEKTAEPDVQPFEAAPGTDDNYRTIEFEGGLSKAGTGGDERRFEVEVPGTSEDIAVGLTDMDQFETKLDLAKAYVDMEDEESAREILQDIVANGNEKQKSEARSLMEKIGPAGSELFAPESRAGRV